MSNNNNNDLQKKALIGDIMLKIVKLSEKDNNNELISKIRDFVDTLSNLENNEHSNKSEKVLEKMNEIIIEEGIDKKENIKDTIKGKNKEEIKVEENNVPEDKPKEYYELCDWCAKNYVNELNNFQSSLPGEREIGDAWCLGKLLHDMAILTDTDSHYLVKNNYIFKNKSGNFVLVYEPKQFYKSYSILARRGARQPLALILSLDELERVNINEDTIFYLENGEDCNEEIFSYRNLPRSEIGYGDKYAFRSNMLKVKVPFTSKKRSFTEEDKTFIEYLSKYIKFYKYYITLLPNTALYFRFCAPQINFLRAGEILELEDIINLAILFDKSNVDVAIIASNQDNIDDVLSNRELLGRNGKYGVSKDNYYACINSTKCINYIEDFRYLDFEIKDGYSSKQNIRKLYSIIKRTSAIEKFEKLIIHAKTEEEANKYAKVIEDYEKGSSPILEEIEEFYYKKFGEKLNNDSRGHRR